MSTPNLANLLRVPGRLSHSPTSLATAYPHGGTALGTFGEIDVLTPQPSFPIYAEEFGCVVEAIDMGSQWALDATLREVEDADALSKLLPAYAAGVSGGPTLIGDVNASATRAGQRIGSLLSVVLLFTPDSPDDHPWVLIRRAVPVVRDGAKRALRGSAEMGLPVRWYMTPDANGKTYDHGRRRDLTL